MGQQQLLLLVLSTVIVGLATVAGIQAFSEGQSQAAADALNQQLLEYATEAQATVSKPTELGGASSLDGLTPGDMGLGSSNPIETAQGDFEFGDSPGTVSNGNVSCSSGSNSLTIWAEDPNTGAQACVQVTGTDGTSSISTETSVGS